MWAVVRSARVTVGVPTYNRAESLPRALDSVLGQTFRDVELLIADNRPHPAPA